MKLLHETIKLVLKIVDSVSDEVEKNFLATYNCFLTDTILRESLKETMNMLFEMAKSC